MYHISIKVLIMSLETVEHALAEFYCNQNVEVHKILLDFQNSVDSWNLVWNMLDTAKVIYHHINLMVCKLHKICFYNFSLMKYNFLVQQHSTSKLPNNGHS